ncbi:hypothetical protein [Actinoplanes sp. URMC 104]|uniref:hypothetical protein n=1 Tax=Actinoplanes sp. URMC 104 TaxID=3423409 RepID=UPI003F1C387D
MLTSDTSNVYLFAAVALAFVAIWAVVKAAAPLLAVLRVVAGAAFACIAIGAALALVVVSVVGH